MNINRYKEQLAKYILKIQPDIYLLALIIIASFAFKFYFAFYYMDYEKLLYSDMGGYWARANERFEGKIFNAGQIMIWPTLYHFILTDVFKIIDFFGSLDRKLEIIIFLNIVISSISVIFVYLIAKKIIKDKLYSLIATTFYAFQYFLIQINGFILSENLAIPLLIISVYLLFSFPDKKFIIFMTGIVFGFVCGIRPIFGFFGISYVIYIFFSLGRNFKSLIRCFCFSLGFLSVIFGVIVENNHISKGDLKVLSAHGGIHFFFSQCKPVTVKAIYNNVHAYLAPPILLANPDTLAKTSVITTDIPFYRQDYYYKEGFKCLKEHPENIVENFEFVKGLFFGPFFPMVQLSKGFSIYKEFTSLFVFISFISLGLLYYLFRDNVIDKTKVLFLISLPLWTILKTYLFTCDKRCFLPVVFATYILFFAVIKHFKNHRKS